MNTETHHDLNQLAALTAPEFKFSSAEITGASAKHIDLISNTMESARALTETAGKSLIGGMTVALATGSGLAGGLVGAGLAVHTVFSGSKKDSPNR